MSSLLSIVGLLYCLATCTSASSTSLLRTRQLSSSQSPPRRTAVSSDPTSGYALYTLPPFTVTFTSSYSTTGLPDDPEERNQLLLATLHQPLQLITGEFLMESFRIEIALVQEPLRNATQHDQSLQEVLDSFMTLDLQVAVRTAQHLSLTDGVRRLQDNDGTASKTRDYEESVISSYSPPSTTTSNNNNNDDLIQPTDENAITGSSEHSAAPRDNTPRTDLLQFEADFFTTAAFLEPTIEGSKPSKEEVAQLMGGWINDSFDNDFSIYRDRLINSETGVLRHIEHIHIETDSDATYDPYTIGTAPNIPADAVPADNAPDTTESANAAAPSSHATAIGGWSNSEKLFFTLLVSVSIVSIAGLLLALKKYKRRGRALDRIMEENQHALDDDYAFADPRACISGRHSDEIMDILNASDRYLANYRPDLLEAEQRNAIVPVATNNEDTNRPTERRYVTATNPFSYLYGASYFHSEKQAVEQDRARNATKGEDPMAGVELHEAVPDDEDLDLVNKAGCDVTDQTVSGYLQAWFQQVVGTRAAAAADAYKGEEYCYNYEDDDLEVEELEEGQEVAMACDEDPSKYAFAYQDFPRQDGTPCLIYEETLDEEQEEEYLKNSQRNSLHSTTRYGVHDPLTDDEFRRALSQRSLMDIHSNSNSFEQQDTCGDSVVESQAEEEEDAQTSGSSSVLDDNSDESDPAKFTDKLEKMLAMRHRHYEKQKIMEKHREQRRQERARQRAEEKHQQKEEMQKRDRLLRRHSLELDIQELEANIGSGASGPPASASKIITPPSDQRFSGHQQQASWHQQQGDLRQLQKPNLHRRTSSEADAGLAAPIPAAASAVVGIQTNRSMDLEESAVFDPTGNDMTAKSAPHKNARLVQSARKAPRAITHTPYDGVFRTTERISPLSANSSSSSGSSNHLPPMSVPKLGGPPVVSPTSSMTDTGTDAAPNSSGTSTSSRSTPPLGMGSNSMRDGSSARRKKRTISSASAALAKGFQKRRTMSFSNVEEKKTEDDTFHNSSPDMSTSSRGREAMVAEPQHQRSNSVNRHRRSNSSSPADVMVHGVYAQFV